MLISDQSLKSRSWLSFLMREIPNIARKILPRRLQQDSAVTERLNFKAASTKPSFSCVLESFYKNSKANYSSIFGTFFFMMLKKVQIGGSIQNFFHFFFR